MITADEAKKWFDTMLGEIGEAARVKSIDPYRSQRVVERNGRKMLEYLPFYDGLVIILTSPVVDSFLVRHLIDQNINADCLVRGDLIRLDRRVENIPFTAPQPRYEEKR